MPFIELPIIDIVRICGASGGVGDRAAEAQKLVDAFTDVGFCLLKNMAGIGYRKDEIKECMDWFYRQTTPQERLDQLGLRGFNPNNTNVYRGLFPPEKDKLSCKEALDMGEDFPSYSKPSNKERADNPLMCDTPRLNFPDDPERQAQADRFHKV